MPHLVGQGPTAAAGGTSVFFTTPFPHKPGERARDREGNEYLFVDFTGTVYYGTLVQINSANRAAPLLGTAAEAYRVGVVMGGQASTVSNDHPTSDHAGWVQVYGMHPAVQTGAASDGLVSDSTVAGYWCLPQTSIGSPSGTLSLLLQIAGTSIAVASTDGNLIYNMWLVPFGEVTDMDITRDVTWPGVSGASGPTSRNAAAVAGGGDTSGAPSSAFIGNTYAVMLNYPYVVGNTVNISTSAVT